MVHRDGRSEQLFTCLVVACSIVALVYAIRVRERPAADGAARMLSIYASTASDLPATGPVGFVSAIADRSESDTERDLAGSALAPRVLVPDLGAVSFAITTTSAPATLDDDPRLRDFALLTTSPGGVRIYRRRP